MHYSVRFWGSVRSKTHRLSAVSQGELKRVVEGPAIHLFSLLKAFGDVPGVLHLSNTSSGRRCRGFDVARHASRVNTARDRAPPLKTVCSQCQWGSGRGGRLPLTRESESMEQDSHLPWASDRACWTWCSLGLPSPKCRPMFYIFGAYTYTTSSSIIASGTPGA